MASFWLLNGERIYFSLWAGVFLSSMVLSITEWKKNKKEEGRKKGEREGKKGRKERKKEKIE